MRRETIVLIDTATCEIVGEVDADWMVCSGCLDEEEGRPGDPWANRCSTAFQAKPAPHIILPFSVGENAPCAETPEWPSRRYLG